MDAVIGLLDSTADALAATRVTQKR